MKEIYKWLLLPIWLPIILFCGVGVVAGEMLNTVFRKYKNFRR